MSDIVYVSGNVTHHKVDVLRDVTGTARMVAISQTSKQHRLPVGAHTSRGMMEVRALPQTMLPGAKTSRPME
jgi:hypothetical protein